MHERKRHKKTEKEGEIESERERERERVRERENSIRKSRLRFLLFLLFATNSGLAIF